MWSWLLGIKKCFGGVRKEEGPDAACVGGSEVSHAGTSLKSLQSSASEVGEDAQQPAQSPGTPQQPRPLLVAEADVPKPSLQAVEQPAAQPPTQESSSSCSGSPTKKLPARTTPGKSSPNSVRGGGGSYSASHLNTARIAKVTRGSAAADENSSGAKAAAVRTASPKTGLRRNVRAAGLQQGQRASRLSVKTPASQASLRPDPSRSEEEKPLKVHDTPFAVRLDRELNSAHGRQPEASRANPSNWVAPVVLEPSARQMPDAKSTLGLSNRSASAVDTKGEAGSLQQPSPATSPQRGGKENTAKEAAVAGLKNAEEPLPRSRTDSKAGSVLAPKLHLRLPFSDSPFAGAVVTPSPTHAPRFVMNTDDSFGTPNVVGIENLHTQYREDKRLRVHDTPFEERVERFIETERAWKESRLSVHGSEASV